MPFMPGGREVVLSGMLTPMLHIPSGGCWPAPENLRMMMAASSEGLLLRRRSSTGWSSLWAGLAGLWAGFMGLWTGLRLGWSSKESYTRQQTREKFSISCQKTVRELAVDPDLGQRSWQVPLSAAVFYVMQSRPRAHGRGEGWGYRHIHISSSFQN